MLDAVCHYTVDLELVSSI